MNNIALQTDGLSKHYRLYKTPRHRILDILGLLRKNGEGYAVHKALEDISVTIGRGEKVAIIGRNGAGKSTFLKLVSGVIEPTKGQICVNADVRALLQIGAGFHPDFTGRENAIAYLAQLGVGRDEADEKIKDIISFSELDDYIDQPVKTYSTGMNARLAFATSTVVDPDVLILDEVLSVGDAYFSRKSFDHIRDLAERHGTTVLLVTHDMYAASTLCDRVLWLDKGLIKADGPAKFVLEAYEESIKEQEEHRLNIKRLASLQENKDSAENDMLLCDIRRQDGRSDGPLLALSRMNLLIDGEEIAAIDVAAPQEKSEQNSSQLVLDGEEGNWSTPETIDGIKARRFQNYGSIFHKLPFQFAGKNLVNALEGGRMSLGFNYYAEADDIGKLTIVHPDGQQRFVADMPFRSKGWQVITVAPEPDFSQMDLADQNGNALGRRFGNRRFEITDVVFLGGNDAVQHRFLTGDAMKVELTYRINDPDFNEKPVLIVAFQRDGLVRSNRFYSKNIHFSAKDKSSGKITILSDPILLGTGNYFVTIGVYAEGYYDGVVGGKFFSSSPDVYDIHSRSYEIEITRHPEHLYNDIVFFHPSRWSINGGEEIIENVMTPNHELVNINGHKP